ncbi:hypothetical protein LINGRAHAP2_LOCUS13363 [Linum grandiflorum]
MAINSHHTQKRLLHELLQDDQEPFLLHSYISDRRRQIVRTRPKPPPSAASKKRKPITHHQKQHDIIPYNKPTSRSSSSCFFSFSAASPASDPRKSPLYLGKRSPLTASPKTASVLLEAALRISRNASNKRTGIFGSLVKRLTNGGRKKNKTAKKIDGVKVDCSPVNVVGRSRKSKSSSPSTLSGPSWTESSSSLSEDDDDEFVNEMFEFGAYEDNRYCESPFHFVLQPHDGCRTPDFSSPAASPFRLRAEGNENNKDGESLKKCQTQKQQAKTDDADADAEEKEQCSPVSVLDPPFDDDDEEEDDDRTEDDGFDNLDCSFTFVQRTKQHLLHKLCRFEKLAELDPIELDKLMLDHEQEGEEDTGTDHIDEFVMESSFQCSRNKIPRDMKMLVSDLIDEEENYQQERHNNNNNEVVAKRVCKRFESWEEVESNTIDMMVEQDFDRSQGEWRRKQDEVGDIAKDIEAAIFGLLVEELTLMDWELLEQISTV